MDRLSDVIVFTGNLAGARRFYEGAVGLSTREESAGHVELDCGGATLALHATADAGPGGVQLRFATDDLESRARALRARGLRIERAGVDPILGGKLASFRDPEGNRLALWQPTVPPTRGTGMMLSVVINCRDLSRTKEFYRDALGIPVAMDSPWWVQLAAGEAGLGLHPLTDGPAAETHHGRPITVGFGVPGFRTWIDEAHKRGLAFTSPPTDRGFGVFADAVDPDGNPVTFRDAPDTETLEEQLAEPFEDDAEPQRAAFRKPIKKRATSGSRLALKPEHPPGKKQQARLRSQTPSFDPVARGATKHNVDIASARGSGPVRERRKPKRTHDTKRARAKPAIGRLRKAEQRTATQKKVAVASASKSKPVKQASRGRTAKGRLSRGRAGR